MSWLHVLRQWGGEMYQEHAHWKHMRRNTCAACAAHWAQWCILFPIIEDNSSQREYAWSVWLLSLCKPGLISPLIVSPWFCGATTWASTDVHRDWFAADHFLVGALVRVTKLRTRCYRRNNLVGLHAARRHDASIKALLVRLAFWASACHQC